MMSFRFPAALAAASLFLPLVGTAQETKPAATKPAATKPAATKPASAEQPPARPPAPPFKLWHPRTPKDEASHKVAKWGPRGLPSPGYAFFAEKILPITSAPIIDGRGRRTGAGASKSGRM